jgi:hypothetical protein
MSTPNIPRHLGREQQIQAFGESFTLSRWDRAVWWQLLDWCRAMIPDPLAAVEPTILRLASEQARLAAIAPPPLLMLPGAATVKPPDEAQVAKARQAQQEAQIIEHRASQLLSAALDKRLYFLSVNSPEVQALINSFEGSTKVLGLLLTKHHADLAEDDHFEIMRSQTGLDTIFDTALGRAPGPAKGNALAPAA